MAKKKPELAKLRWRCRRGTKELDTLTSRYFDHFYPQASVAEQCAFERLLEMQDPELYRILVAEQPAGDPLIKNIVTKIHLA